MPKIIQIISPQQSSSPMPPPRSYTVMQYKSIQNDDDDDICPVCESECTCKNIASTSAAAVQQQTQSTSTSTPLPALKIKLPPRNPSNSRVISKQATVKRAGPKSSKPKQMTAGSASIDGIDCVVLHHTGPSTAGIQTLDASTSSLRDTSPLTPQPELTSLASRPKQQTIHKTKKKPTPARLKQSASRQLKKKSGITPKSKKNKDTAWTSPSARRKGKNVIHLVSDESEDDLSYENVRVPRMTIDSDDAGSVQFPTFVSAISTTSDNEGSTTSMNDSFDSDSSIPAENEDLILAEEQRAKVKRELLNGEESWHMEKRKWDHLKNNNNWEIRPRKRSVGPDDTGSGTDSESESDMEVGEEEEEGEGDEDDDPDIRCGRGPLTGWQSSDDDDDDELDAELFFATLTDSSGPGSDADAEDEEDSGDETDNSDFSTISMTEAAVTGLLRPPFDSECPLVVTEDWDGRLVFANGLRDGQGVLDVHFEVNATQHRDTVRETMDMDEDEEAQDVDHDDEDVFVSEGDGETTDDMLDHIVTHGAAPLPPRCPTPPVHSIDPLSTLSPIVGSRRKPSKAPLTAESRKPADILASAGRIFFEGADKDSPVDRSRSASLATASPPGTSVSSSQSRQPRMGSFLQVSSDPKRRAIIDGKSAVLVSPFARVRRVRRGRERKRIIVRNELDSNPSKRPRQSSLPGESLAILQAAPDDPDEAMIQSSPELLPPTSIGLDDVLDASFLDSDASASASETTVDAHLRNLTRWDRVPMGTFRRSRTTHLGMFSSVTSSNDGVSYGSAGGHVLRKATGGAALWQRDQKLPPRHPPGSVTVSPVIFPVRDGEKAPFIIRFDDPPILSPSHPPKRKGKRRRSRPINNSPFTTHTPSAIIPPLNL